MRIRNETRKPDCYYKKSKVKRKKSRKARGAGAGGRGYLAGIDDIKKTGLPKKKIKGSPVT
jgi:hypothetical protein